MHVYTQWGKPLVIPKRLKNYEIDLMIEKMKEKKKVQILLLIKINKVKTDKRNRNC